jgi:hypothetical protein
VRQNQTHGYANRIKENNHFCEKPKGLVSTVVCSIFVLLTCRVSSGHSTGPGANFHAVAEREKLMKLAALISICLFASGAACADEAAQCRANDGTYLSGSVTRGPTFARGRYPLHGVKLSHTHLTLLSDQDRQSYDVAVDDVFAPGYDAAGESVPAPLSTIREGNRLEVCGRPYMDETGPGIDWVHTNCGATPTTKKPNGWLKIIGANGSPGPNLESNQKYCYLWRQQ